MWVDKLGRYWIYNFLIRSQRESENTSILTYFPVIIRILHHFFVVIYGSLRVIPQRVADFVADFVIVYHQGVICLHIWCDNAKLTNRSHQRIALFTPLKWLFQNAHLKNPIKGEGSRFIIDKIFRLLFWIVHAELIQYIYVFCLSRKVNTLGLPLRRRFWK